MRLFLASTFSDSVKLFTERVKSGRVAFIANPADLYKSKYWAKKDYLAFVNNGFEVTKLDLRKFDQVELTQELQNYDIIHVCGGSAVYILKLLKDNFFDMVITDYVNAGMIYTGTSAGSMICAPDISFCADDEDEQEVGMVGKLKDLSGLGFAPYYMMCHCQEKYYIPSTKRAMNRLSKNKIPILFLNDGMAVWHDNEKMEIVNT